MRPRQVDLGVLRAHLVVDRRCLRLPCPWLARMPGRTVLWSVP